MTTPMRPGAPLDVVPRIESARLHMRGFVDADIDRYAAWLGDEPTSRYIGGKPLDRADAWRSMSMMMGHWVLRGYGMWAIVEKSSGELVGRVGLWNPEGWPGIECGWLIAPDKRKLGYAQEAAATAIEWGRTTLALARVISIIHVDNAASIKTAVALGQTRAEERDVRGFRCAVYAKDL